MLEEFADQLTFSNKTNIIPKIQKSKNLYCVDGSWIASISLSSVSGAEAFVGIDEDDTKFDVLEKQIILYKNK